MNNRYYITYGPDGEPYQNGWSEVIAPTLSVAESLLKVAHPYAEWCSTYTEEEFKRTRMFTEGNFGHRCYEIISLNYDQIGEIT